MGILSFLTGGNGDSQPANPEGTPSNRGRPDDAPAPAAGAGGPEAPAAGDEEPGAGIADLEPLGSPSPAGSPRDTADDSRGEPLAPDWWRSASGDVGAQGRSAGDPGADTGGWTLGALFEPPASEGPPLAVGPPDPKMMLELKPRIVDALSTVFDPEIPVNIYELGLVYEIIVDANALVLVRMTLTSPACPSAQQLPSEVQYKVKAVAGVTDAAVEVVWDPPWTKDMMSDAAKLSLGIW